jgi:hypothetical protein
VTTCAIIERDDFPLKNCFPGAAEEIRHGLFDESQGQLPGSRPDRKLALKKAEVIKKLARYRFERSADRQERLFP